MTFSPFPWRRRALAGPRPWDHGRPLTGLEAFCLDEAWHAWHDCDGTRRVAKDEREAEALAALPYEGKVPRWRRLWR